MFLIQMKRDPREHSRGRIWYEIFMNSSILQVFFDQNTCFDDFQSKCRYHFLVINVSYIFYSNMNSLKKT